MKRSVAYFSAAVVVITVGFYILAHLLVGSDAARLQKERATTVARAVAWVAGQEMLREDDEAEGATQRFVSALPGRIPSLERALVLDGTKLTVHTDASRVGKRLSRDSLADKDLFDASNAMKADVRKNDDEREKNPSLERDAYKESTAETDADGRIVARVPVKVEGDFEAMAEAVMATETIPAPFPFVLALIAIVAVVAFVPLAWKLRGPALMIGGGALLALTLYLQIDQLRGWRAEVRQDRVERLARTVAQLAAAGLLDEAAPGGLATLAPSLSLDTSGFATQRVLSLRPTGGVGSTLGEGLEVEDGGFAVAVSKAHVDRLIASQNRVLDRWAAGIGLLGALIFVLGLLGQLDRAGRALETHRSAYTYLSPAMLGLLVLVFIPVVYGVSLGFQTRVYNEYEFVGLKNYASLLSNWDIQDPRNFYFTLGVTVMWTVTNVVLHVSIGLFMALLLNDQMLKAKGIYRVLLVVPWAIPNYVTALIWKSMFHKQFGAVNALLETLGFEGLSWFITFWPAFSTNVTTNTWLGFPFMMVVSLGALQSIPTDLYEAARVDGASRWQRFSKITFPLLLPALVPAVIVGTVWTFNMFNIIYLVSGGAPDGATDILITEAYRWAFEADRKGFAAAYSTVIFLILLAFTLITNRITGATKGAFE